MTEITAASASNESSHRWRSLLTILTLGGLLVALLTGSLLLFFAMSAPSRAYWVLAHWLLAAVALPCYALYQFRHYLRVRQHVRQTHYRVGLHGFFLACGATLTGLLLVTPLHDGTAAYSITDLAHIFFSYAFTLLLGAHLTLVALRSTALANANQIGNIRNSISLFFIAAGALAAAVVGAAMLLRYR